MSRAILPLVDRVLQGGLAKHLTSARADGQSYEEIARALHVEHDVNVSGETVRKWCRELGVEDAA